MMNFDRWFKVAILALLFVAVLAYCIKGPPEEDKYYFVTRGKSGYLYTWAMDKRTGEAWTCKLTATRSEFRYRRREWTPSVFPIPDDNATK